MCSDLLPVLSGGQTPPRPPRSLTNHRSPARRRWTYLSYALPFGILAPFSCSIRVNASLVVGYSLAALPSGKRHSYQEAICSFFFFASFSLHPLEHLHNSLSSPFSICGLIVHIDLNSASNSSRKRAGLCRAPGEGPGTLESRVTSPGDQRATRGRACGAKSQDASRRLPGTPAAKVTHRRQPQTFRPDVQALE